VVAYWAICARRQRVFAVDRIESLQVNDAKPTPPISICARIRAGAAARKKPWQ